jgi:hypothetical protein
MRLPAGAPGLRGCIWADQVTAQRPINGRVPRLHPFVHKDLLPSGGAISCEVGASPKRVYLPLQGGDFGTNAVKLETTIEWSTESKGAFHFMPIWAALPLVRGAIAYTSRHHLYHRIFHMSEIQCPRNTGHHCLVRSEQLCPTFLEREKS